LYWHLNPSCYFGLPKNSRNDPEHTQAKNRAHRE
jgi:hypothetical protein